ncbi:MAG: LON peptidase substrate-binding domain-containing protein, partial [Hespellia sp.]|nr:LON peptidase substrate-binding domain-containing protein [Hespellia sp.]
MENQIISLPVVALRGLTIMPGMVVHFDISRDASIEAVEASMNHGEQKLFLVTQKSTETEKPGAEDVFRVGTYATIKQVVKLPKNIFRVLVSGETRGILQEMQEEKPYLRAKVEIIDDSDYIIPEAMNEPAMERGLREMFVEYAAKSTKMSKEQVAQITNVKGLKKTMDEIA